MLRPVHFLVVALLSAPLLASAPTHAQTAATPGLFLVGAAVRDITPPTPQYLGGYGTDRVSHGIDGALEVRAFAVSNLTGATVMWAEVDTQGYFSGYKEGPLGTLDVRQAVAAATGVPGGHIVVASSHSHAAPTVMGIWGPTDVSYLKLVHDQTIAALEAAFAARESANLFVGRGEAPDLIGSAIGFGDMMPGWPVDGTLSTLHAVAPDGHAVATFINFGDHADIVGKQAISPDWLGPARDYVQARLGGVVVVAEGTLGHQESPIEDNRGGDPYQQIVRFGDLIGARAMATLASAKPVLGDAVDGDMEYFAFPATNPALMALDLGVSARGVPVAGDAVDDYPIDRSILPPFAAPPVLASWTGALRFGDEVLFTLPGEAFPEVSAAIRDHLVDCHGDFALGLANDQFGYYWMTWEAPNAMPVGDFLVFNVNPALGDIVSRLDLLAASKLGCATDPTPDAPSYHGTGSITGNDPAGVQALAFPEATTPGADITFEGMSDGGAPVTWDFGDAAVAGGERVHHAYATTGEYTATATISSGASWLVHVHVFPVPTASVAQTLLPDGSVEMRAGLLGASGHALQAIWSFSDGTTQTGLRVVKAPGVGYQVHVADASGLVAATSG